MAGSIIKKYWRQETGLVFFVAIMGAAFWLAAQAEKSAIISDSIARYGHVGIFLASILSGFNLVVPIPIISFLPSFLASGLSFWPTVIIITTGMVVGDAIGYLLGRAGRLFLTKPMLRSLARLEKLSEEYFWAPIIILFLFASLVPLPNELLVLPLAVLGYRFYYILPALFFGNLLFNIYSGYGILKLLENIT